MASNSENDCCHPPDRIHSRRMLTHIGSNNDQPTKRTLTTESDLEESNYGMNKRGRAKSEVFVSCPIAYAGCEKTVSINKLSEHYQSEQHKTVLMVVVQEFIKGLHNKPFQQENDDNNEEKIDMNQMAQVTNILADTVSSLHEDHVLIHQKMIQLQETLSSQRDHISQLKGSIEETVQALHASQINGNLVHTELASLKQNVADFVSQSSTNGTYIWKISDVAQKLKDAREDRQTSVYSAPFYTSPTGYKMCLRLYFNGDGQARGTHLSLFFVLMRGDYDAILTWPFSYKVTFCLFDQTGAQKHIIDAFRPDPKSNSFQRPRSNMNIASGIPKFLPLSIIQADNNLYVRDDCMFIRCVVDVAGIPKTMIPFLFNINPGLPNHMQQSMIQAEMQKYQNNLMNTTNDQNNTNSLS